MPGKLNPVIDTPTVSGRDAVDLVGGGRCAMPDFQRGNRGRSAALR
jgi:hypothetical protein